MGNFHCIPSSCARVVWREYLPPVVRWRYENEDWQEIEADDYAIEQKQGQCRGIQYYVDIYRDRYRHGQLIERNALKRDVVYGEIEDAYIENTQNDTHPNLTAVYSVVIGKDRYGRYNYRRSLIDGDGRTGILKSVNIHRVDKQPDNCGDCIFTVYKNDEIVHEETRDVCSEVEKLPCRLSDISKEIKIDKFAYLERIEVIPWRYQNTLGLLPLAEGDYASYRAIIPDECLNIYKNLTVTIIPQGQSFGTPTNATQASYGFITQICSAPDCPPPEYTVICDCDNCRECPADTCAVACDGHVCCYDTTTGKAVNSIPLAEYCNDIGGGKNDGGGAGGDF